jgi:hypothetical protein
LRSWKPWHREQEYTGLDQLRALTSRATSRGQLPSSDARGVQPPRVSGSRAWPRPRILAQNVNEQ